MLEKQFESKMRKWLTSMGIYEAGTPEQHMNSPVNGWFTKIWGGGYQKSGIPDYLMCVNGVFISVETKSSNGKPSELQIKNTKMINAAGGIGLVLYPSGFDKFKQIIKGVIECRCPTADLNVLSIAKGSTDCNMWIS